MNGPSSPVRLSVTVNHAKKNNLQIQIRRDVGSLLRRLAFFFSLERQNLSSLPCNQLDDEEHRVWLEDAKVIKIQSVSKYDVKFRLVIKTALPFVHDVKMA